MRDKRIPAKQGNRLVVNLHRLVPRGLASLRQIIFKPNFRIGPKIRPTGVILSFVVAMEKLPFAVFEQDQKFKERKQLTLNW